MIKVTADFAKNMFSLKGKVALVTGALGGAVAKAYSYQGAKVDAYTGDAVCVEILKFLAD